VILSNWVSGTLALFLNPNNFTRRFQCVYVHMKLTMKPQI
jgi:hypothetical protein